METQEITTAPEVQSSVQCQ